MKRPISPAYTFNPGAATLNLSGIGNFALGNLFAVIDLRTGALVYAPIAGFGAAAVSGTTLTLQAPMAGLAAGDPLMILYDDGGKPSEDASVQAVTAAVGSLAATLASNHGDLATLHGDVGTTLHNDLQAILADLASGLTNDGTALGAITATATWQANVLTALAALLTKLGTRLSVSIDGDSIALSLPSGLALDASVQSAVSALASLNTALASNHGDLTTLHADVGSTLHADLGAILGKIPGLGQAAAAASLPVVLASDGPFATTVGSQADAAAASDTGAFSLVALTKRALQRLTSILAVLPASLGQKAMAAAFPVAIASDQSAVLVTAGKATAVGDTSITAGGTAQALFGGAVPANGWKVANPDSAEDLWVSDSATAGPGGQGCYRVPAGGILTTEPLERPCGPVTVYGATTGHAITARSW